MSPSSLPQVDVSSLVQVRATKATINGFSAASFIVLDYAPACLECNAVAMNAARNHALFKPELAEGGRGTLTEVRSIGELHVITGDDT